jgi:translation initiation factor IF-2
MKVRDLAKKLNIDRDNLRSALAEYNIKLPPKAKQIDDRMAHSIITRFEKLKEKEERQRQKEANKPKEPEKKKVVQLPPVLSVKDFADRLDMEVTEVMKELMKNGIFATLNESIDHDTAAIVADELGYEIEKIAEESEKLTSVQLRKMLIDEKASAGKDVLTARAPIVTILGHVDHGKTTLLDAVRKTNVVAGESGGITQRIGAYQAKRNKQTITFLDTPGHEAFSAMRARGANVTDIAVLVVAADDGVRPQTEESVRLARQAEVPIVVAINKIDKPDANPDKIKKELAEKLDLNPEEWGGDVIMVPLSAKNGEGIDNLLDAILLVADVYKFVGDPKRDALGTVIESHLDSQVGPVLTVILQAGTLRVGDVVLVGSYEGKIKAMWDHAGKEISEAHLSQPVRILGLHDVPEAGDVLQVVESAKQARQMSKQLKSKDRLRTIARAQLYSGGETVDGEVVHRAYNIILRADVQGSLEAIRESIHAIDSSIVELRILDATTGDITESDVALAKTSGAVVLGFNVHPTIQAQRIADKNKVRVQEFSVIYELLDFIKKDASELLPPTIERANVGRLKVLKVFKTSRGEMIVGGRVDSGKIVKGAKIEVMRDGESLGFGVLKQLQSNKVDVAEVKHGSECGVTFAGDVRIAEDDVLQVFSEKEIEQKIV